MNILCTSRTRAFVAIAVLVVVSVLLLGSLAHGQTNDTLQVDYIDVGQGDSILLRASDGTDILIDGGLFQAGPTVVAHLQDKGIDDIDVMILTHADTDHVGGLIHVLSSTIPVESVLYNGQDNTSQDYLYFLTQAQRQGITPTLVQAGQSFTWGSINAVVLNPQATPGAGQNENSVTLLITYGEVRFLFTGDIGSDTEQTLLEGVAGTQTLRQWLPANVLKVAHHGSGGSSSAPFLEAVGAECAVISVGANNSYGHPAQETLDRLQAAGAQVLRTDQLGAITLTTDGQTIEGCTRTFVFLPLAMQQAHLAPAPPPAGNVVITTIFYDGVEGSQEPDEYVEIRNDDAQAVQLGGWTLRDESSHAFTFPSFEMQPGQTCRVYTNEQHPEWCGFSYGNGAAIWNNSGDCARLRDGTEVLVDDYCY